MIDVNRFYLLRFCYFYSMKTHPLVKAIEKEFVNHLDDENAIGMKAYMRDQFDFLGLKKPLRAELLKPVFDSFKAVNSDEWPLIVQQVWNLKFREFQYVAMELCRKKSKDFQAGHLPLLEKMILEKSWWDTVDFVASNLVGDLFKRHPELIDKTISKWLKTENFWLHRTAIIFQLKYGKHTDQQLLFSLCSRYAEEKEFFIRKAIGWALRQYSKSNPGSVRDYIKKQKLSPLSVKEASKYI